jgi:hypothetical protein
MATELVIEVDAASAQPHSIGCGRLSTRTTPATACGSTPAPGWSPRAGVDHLHRTAAPAAAALHALLPALVDPKAVLPRPGRRGTGRICSRGPLTRATISP